MLYIFNCWVWFNVGIKFIRDSILIKKIGFFLDTLALCIFLMRLLGYKRWKILIPAAIGITAAVFGVFYGLLNVPLPTIFL